MSAETLERLRQPAGKAPGAVIARLVGRRAARSAVVWGLVFGIYVVASASGFATEFPTAASRLKFARSLGTNAGIKALIGPARRIDTVAGFTSWRCLGVLSLVGAAWGLLTGTRLLRGEEDAGRWEVLLAGQTTHRRAAAQGLAGLAAGWGALWAVTAVMTVAEGRAGSIGFPVRGSLFLSVSLVSSAAVFLAIGALASQLAATRRQAASLAAVAFGAAFLLRMVADADSGLRWVLWASPLGWVEELHPLTGSRPAMLLPIAALAVVAALAAVHLAGQRDLGASTLPARDTAPARTGLLSGPGGLAVRLTRPVAVGWIVAIGLGGLVFGLVAQSAANAVSGSATVERALGRLGGTHGGASAFLALAFLVSATLVALVVAGQVVASREEEADGRLDHLLVRPVGRLRWLTGRLAVAAGAALVSGLAGGLLAWAGAASQQSGLGFARLVEAGANTVPPALFLLGLGTLVHAGAPRAVGAVTYGLIAWSFLVELVGTVIKMSHWVLDTSVLYHVAPAPAANPHWVSAAGLAGLGLAAAGLGGVVFTRRDLVSA